MVKLNKYGFIFIAPGYEASGKIVNMSSELFGVTIAGVSTIESGCVMAKEMVKNGAQVIELCGGFKEKDLKKIKDAIDKKIPVGLVKFDSAEKLKLKSFLEK
jgi:hypothetical protein